MKKVRQLARDRLRREKIQLLAGSAMRANYVIFRTNGKTAARSVEDFYGFKPEDVRQVYARKIGHGAGLWFRLKDGRVVDAVGKPSDRNHARYVIKPLPNTPPGGRIPTASKRTPVNANRSWHSPGPHPQQAPATIKIGELPRHAIPDDVFWEIAHKTMNAHFKALSAKGKNRGASTPESFYGFRAQDVDEMHFRKHGFGRGVWYRLKDGRVIDALAKPSEPGRHWYAAKLN